MARKSKRATTQDDQTEESGDETQEKTGIFETIFRTVKAVVGLHISVFAQEVRDFGSAILSSLVLMLVAGVFLFGFWLLLMVLGVIALHDFAGLSYFYSVMIVAGANALVATILLLTARNVLRKNSFPLTKKLIQDIRNIFK